MNQVVATVGPVFGLIALGLVARRTGLLAPGTGKGLADFVFTIAMPALLFRTLARVDLPATLPMGLLVSFFGATAASWVLASIATRMALARPGADAAPIAMGAAFGNTVMMGIPLALGHFGEAAAAPLALLVALHAPALWLVGTLQAEALIGRGHVPWPRLIGALALDLARNPILLGIVGGLAWRQTGLHIHPVADKIVALLGEAAVPSALFALGMSVAHFQVKGEWRTLAVINVLKLLVYPLIAWLLAAHVFALGPVAVGVAVILAACPTGANAFLFAARYERAVSSISGSIALGTALSLLTISLLLFALGAPNAPAR